jgi:methyl-accepting chemotaxis protein
MKLKIGTQLILGFMFAVIVSVLIGFIGITNIHVIDAADTKLYEKATIPTGDMAWIAASFHQIRVNARDMIRANEPGEIASKYNRIKELNGIIEEHKTSYEKTYLSEDDKKQFEAFIKVKDAFVDIITRDVYNLAKMNRDADGYALLDGEANVLGKDVQKKMEEIVTLNIQAAKEIAEHNTELANRSSAIMIAIIVIGSIIALILGVFLSISIANVIKMLISESNKLTEAAVAGKLATRGDVNKINWEFRPIVEGVNKTLDAVIGPLNVAAEYVDRISKGDLPPKITDNYNGDFNEIKNNLNAMIDSMNEITNGAKEMAAGNLTVQLKVRSDRDELMKALSSMIANLRNMIQKIVESADQIAASSEELSKTAQNLSEGSQKQAASLEEASSSMEEMSSSVEQVANKAQNQASSVEEVTSSMEELNASIKGVADMAVKVKDGAQGAVNQAIGAEKSSEETNMAMKKIEESSIKISKIINVISDIADQTNLLALNASIEAARAGDAGRGFAVVAKEISKLADKSAGATKEIGDLISETNQNVKNGAEMVKVVDGAIKKIREVSEESARFGAEMANATEEQLSGSKQISEAIQNVNSLAQAIASSAEEQSSTSSEMSKTIEKVNEITQHAASSAEEMASSTEELSSQAETLKKLAAQFKI